VASHGARLTRFSAIGGAIFIAGLALQAALTSGLHVPSFLSFLSQSVLSIEASFLLNRWLTWRSRGTAVWFSFWRYNVQKTVTVAANLLLYAVLLRLGMNYLVANVLLTGVFTLINYLGGDRFVFTPGIASARPMAASVAGYQSVAAVPMANPVDYRGAARPMPFAGQVPMANTVGYPDVVFEPANPTTWLPTVSVVIPCRDNERTIRATVESLLGQDYPELREIILIGSPIDTTWEAIADIRDRRLAIQEVEAPQGVRDANFKRDVGIRESSSELVSLIDSDMVLPHDWLSRAVVALNHSGADCVAGVMRSFYDDFWGRFVDSCRLGAKTPRVADPYFVTAENFGAGGRKPPITANVLFTREVYDRCPLNSLWSYGSLEDYEWFWRIVRGGDRVLVTHELFGWHHHRAGLARLAAEYRRSARGCAYFIRAHRNSPFARKRLTQAVGLPLVAAAVLAGILTVAIKGYAMQAAVVAVAVMLVSVLVLCGREFVRTRTLESLVYPLPALLLGASYTASLITHLVRRAPMTAVSTRDTNIVLARDTAIDRAYAPRAPRTPRFALSRLLHPLTTILALQAGLSLTLIWSNTAFSDEAQYLFDGHLEWAHWLHGSPLPSYLSLSRLSGSPVIYPPLGALADGIGGLACARSLSLIFMLCATALLYFTAARLIGRTGALFSAALWVVSEPVIRMAFATYDPLSILLTATAASIIARAGYCTRRGEHVAAAALALALANATAYSGIVIDIPVIAFAFLVWLPRMGRQKALSCSAWLVGATVVLFALVMTGSRSWVGLAAVFSRKSPDHQSLILILNDSWQYSGLLAVIAVVSALLVISAEERKFAALLVSLACTVFVVPASQLYEQTGWSLDEHIAYGIWFAAIAAGYGCSRLIRWLPRARKGIVALSCVIALIYPAVNGWQSAWDIYHSWPDARSFIAAFRPAVARGSGLIYVAEQDNIAQYYTPQGDQLTRWKGSLTNAQLRSGQYGTIVLFYSTTFSSVEIPGNIVLPSHADYSYQEFLQLIGVNSRQPDLPATTKALEANQDYRLISVGAYDTNNISGTHDYGIYAIWQKVTQ
jgi:glycosyltransferase involved in cell wall biosynthesis/putative flippase GtrA